MIDKNIRGADQNTEDRLIRRDNFLFYLRQSYPFYIIYYIIIISSVLIYKIGFFAVKTEQWHCLEENSPFVFIYFSYLMVKRCNNLDQNIQKNACFSEASLQTFIKRGHSVTKTLRKVSFYDFLAQCKCQGRQKVINQSTFRPELEDPTFSNLSCWCWSIHFPSNFLATIILRYYLQSHSTLACD